MLEHLVQFAYLCSIRITLDMLQWIVFFVKFVRKKKKNIKKKTLNEMIGIKLYICKWHLGIFLSAHMCRSERKKVFFIQRSLCLKFLAFLAYILLYPIIMLLGVGVNASRY